jgi:hypothetical protein
MRVALTWSILLLGIPLSAEAGRSRPMPLAAMSRTAETIVVGRITDVRVAPHPRYTGLPITAITLKVSETWKGRHRPTFVFTHFGDVSADGTSPSGSGTVVRHFRRADLPTYAVGEEVVLFLRRPGRSGLTSTVGGHAGKLLVRRKPETGEAMVAPSTGGLSFGSGTLVAPQGRRGPVSLKSVRLRATAALRGAGVRS